MDDIAAQLRKLAEGYELFASAETDQLSRAFMWGCVRGYSEAAKAITEAPPVDRG